MKRIDIHLKKKQEQSRIGGGYLRNFNDEIPQRPKTTNENRDTKSTTSSNTDEEAVTIHKTGAYPAIPVQDYRDDPIEDIAVHYVRINRVVEQKATRNKQQKDNIRAAELDFMMDLETLIEETAAEPDLIELNCCLEDNNSNQIPHEYRTVAKKLTHGWGIIMVDGRIIIPKTLRSAALNALHFGHPGINKIDFTGNLRNKKLQSSPYILITVDKKSRWPVAKICKSTSHETVITFLNEYINVYGEPKRKKSDRGGAVISKEYKEFCKSHNKLRIRHRESTYRNRIGRTNHPINEESDIGKSRKRDKPT